MSDLPKFNRNNPTNEHEKLIMGLINDLDEVTKVFMTLNHKGNLTHEFFAILRDASIGYCSGIIFSLAQMLADKNQLDMFIEETKDIFNVSIDIIRTLKCSTN